MENNSVSPLDEKGIEDLIVAEVKRLQAANKRADFNSVSHAAELKHGLNKGVSTSHIESLVSKNILKIVMRGGAESLRFVQKDKNLENRNDKNTKGKVLNDKEKISECREGLIKEAVMFASDATDERVQKEEGEEIQNGVVNTNEEDSFPE